MDLYLIFGYKWTIFRYLADISHVTSVILLLYKMFREHSCSGVSFKTHLLYLTVFITRYINSELLDFPIWNIVFKFFFLFSSILILYLIKFPLRRTYDHLHDSFKIIILILICLPLAYFTSPENSLSEMIYTFSLWLESVAIVPQLFLLQRTKRIDVLTTKYIFFLGLYRIFYILNWIVRYTQNRSNVPVISWITSLIQAILYGDFLYYYIKAKIMGAEFRLPI